MLHEFLTSRRDEIIARTRQKVAERTTPRPTEDELVNGVPLFFDQLIETLEPPGFLSANTNEGATKHGREMLRAGFTVSQVLHDYENVWEAATELAIELNVEINLGEFHILHHAMAQAVAEYVRLREQSISYAETGRMGALAHQLRNRLTSAVLCFDNLRSGGAAIGGSTGALLNHSLKGIGELIDRSLVEERLQSDSQKRERIWMGELIEEMEAAATVAAKSHGLQLTVGPVEYGLAIDADRQILTGAVANLLQNAFIFTRDHGSVWLSTHASADRVLIDIEDECGGLVLGKIDGLVHPAEHHGYGRTGLGLRISCRGVQANGGEIRVRDLPGRGCIYTIDLPRQVGLARLGTNILRLD